MMNSLALVVVMKNLSYSPNCSKTRGESRVPESLDALFERLASPIPLLHSIPSASEMVIDINTDVPAPNVVETANDAGSLSHALLNEQPQTLPPSSQKRVVCTMMCRLGMFVTLLKITLEDN